jgi:hypothetical protein
MIRIHCPYCYRASPFDNKAKIKIPDIPWKHENGRWVRIKK